MLLDAHKDSEGSRADLRNLHLTALINMWAASLVALLSPKAGLQGYSNDEGGAEVEINDAFFMTRIKWMAYQSTKVDDVRCPNAAIIAVLFLRL